MVSVSVAEFENEGSRPIEWVICGSATREVDAGRVACPHGGRVAVSRCLDCPHLETLEREWSRQGCATPDD